MVALPAIVDGMPTRFRWYRGRKGWHKPNAEARLVCKPSRWRNPYDWRIYGIPKAVEMYRAALLGDQVEAKRVLRHHCAMVQEHLRGRDLGCNCDLCHECHADTLLVVANAPSQQPR